MNTKNLSIFPLHQNYLGGNKLNLGKYVQIKIVSACGVRTSVLWILKTNAYPTTPRWLYGSSVNSAMYLWTKKLFFSLQGLTLFLIRKRYVACGVVGKIGIYNNKWFKVRIPLVVNYFIFHTKMFLWIWTNIKTKKYFFNFIKSITMAV